MHTFNERINSNGIKVADIKVRHMVAGMIVTPTMTKVTTTPTAFVKTPKGKLQFNVEYSNGEVRTVQWGKDTTVTIVIND